MVMTHLPSFPLPHDEDLGCDPFLSPGALNFGMHRQVILGGRTGEEVGMGRSPCANCFVYVLDAFVSGANIHTLSSKDGDT